MKINKYNFWILLCIIIYTPFSLLRLANGGKYYSYIHLFSIYIIPLVSVSLIYIGICLNLERKRAKAFGVDDKIIFGPVFVSSIGAILLAASLAPSVSSIVSVLKNETKENRTRDILISKATDMNITSSGRKNAASVIYLTEGLAIKYIDEHDKLVNCVPSSDEIQKFESRRQEIYRTRYVTGSVKYHFVGSVTIFVLYSSCLFWLYFRKRKSIS